MDYTSIKNIPADSELREHIEYYWIVDNLTNIDGFTSRVNSYPGTTPELLIPLQGYSEHYYRGKTVKNEKPTFYGFIHDRLTSNISFHSKFVLVTFKSRALASVMPFVKYSANEIFKDPIVDADLVFGKSINRLQKKLKEIPVDDIACEIDTWFSSLFQSSKTGFMHEIGDRSSNCISVQHLIEKTNSSYSTIERHFKNETGLTPKQFFVYKRFCASTSIIINSGNKNWLDYVYDFDYYDQSHFIKEVKKYSGFTPSELLCIPSLVKLRPDISFMTNFYNEI